MKNRIILFITIIVCFLLQCTVMDRISIGSITPNLLLILCVSMGLMRGRKVGLWTGFFSGLFVDLFYGSLFGFYALIYMYIGFISGYAFRSFYDDDLKVPLFLVAGTDLLYIWLCMASSFCSEASWILDLHIQDHYPRDCIYGFSHHHRIPGILLDQLPLNGYCKERK